MVDPAALGRRGFTLVEALVAMMLSTLVVILVTTTFLGQNQFYADVVGRSTLQASSRGAAALVSAELRGVTAGGIETAEAHRLIYRVPLVLGGVCAVNGGETYVLFPLGGEPLPEGEIAGYGVRSPASGHWSYTEATWASVHHSSGPVPALTCALAGADTTGATGDFHRLDGLAATPSLSPGDLVMLFRRRELRLGASVLDPESRGLFWGPAGGALTEFASGLSPASGFRYRLAGQSTFLDEVTSGANLPRVRAVRLEVRGVAPAVGAGRDSLTFEISSTVSLRNVR